MVYCDPESKFKGGLSGDGKTQVWTQLFSRWPIRNLWKRLLLVFAQTRLKRPPLLDGNLIIDLRFQLQSLTLTEISRLCRPSSFQTAARALISVHGTC